MLSVVKCKTCTKEFITTLEGLKSGEIKRFKMEMQIPQPYCETCHHCQDDHKYSQYFCSKDCFKTFINSEEFDKWIDDPDGLKAMNPHLYEEEEVEEEDNIVYGKATVKLSSFLKT